jgi:ribulose-5-phosphate 4-epimerase/fuculose-1-phosphate aldolase
MRSAKSPELIMATNPSISSVKSSDEWRLRRELTDFYHLIDYLHWTELIFNHISIRVPGTPHHYLVNPFGLNYSEVTPENLLKVSADGHLVEPSDFAPNPAGFALHGAIHEHRADVSCIAHTHTTAVSAVAMKRRGLDHNNFYGAQLTGRVGYHDFEGITLNPDERSRMLASLGDKHVLVLRNHGIAVCERDIPSAFALLWVVQRAAEIQSAADQISGENIEITDAVRQQCRGSSQDLGARIQVARLVFDATVRRMRSTRP